MKIREREIDVKYVLKSILCIAFGTAVGLVVYAIFLYFNIAIFGWNLGLIFAPLAAGYAETIVANRLLGENLGAISAFILFIDTTYYSFILKNPTLGMNLITAGSIVVILQSAFPTLINYLLVVFIGAVVSNFKWVFKKIKRGLKIGISHIRWETIEEEEDSEIEIYFDENESNNRLNSLDFFFITSTDITSREHEIVGIYHNEVIFENKDTISVKRENIEKQRLVTLKEGKDECLVKLANTVKENGGNGILNLEIQYGLLGMKNDNVHITATGIGIIIK